MNKDGHTIKAISKGIDTTPLIEIEPRYWFNPAAISQHYIIPGAVTIIIITNSCIDIR